MQRRPERWRQVTEVPHRGRSGLLGLQRPSLPPYKGSFVRQISSGYRGLGDDPNIDPAESIRISDKHLRGFNNLILS